MHKPELDKLHTLKTDDPRKYRVYYFYLNKKGIYPEIFNYYDLVNCLRAISDAIHSVIKDTRQLNDFIASMKSGCDAELIPLSAFSWLKKDERACFFAWCFFRNAEHKHLKIKSENERNEGLGIEVIYQKKPYEIFDINPCPANSLERYDAIVSFFDYWQESRGTKGIKMVTIRQSWSDIFRSPDPFPWLDKKNIKQCHWAWRYISSRIENYNIDPLSNDEAYLAIYAAFDIWRNDDKSKDIFAKKMYKTWMQKESRRKNPKQKKDKNG